jgi:hypothetical protein
MIASTLIVNLLLFLFRMMRTYIFLSSFFKLFLCPFCGTFFLLSLNSSFLRGCFCWITLLILSHSVCLLQNGLDCVTTMDELFRFLDIESSRMFGMESEPFVDINRDVFYGEPEKITTVVRKDRAVVNGQRTVIRRVYARFPAFSPYQNIGWVLYCDIHQCMICSKKFPRLIGKRMKRHCKICGNIVCNICLTGAVVIKELKGGYVDACSNCYWGQVFLS